MNTGLVPLQVISPFFCRLRELALSMIEQASLDVRQDFLSPVFYCSFDVMQTLTAQLHPVGVELAQDVAGFIPNH